MTATTIAFLSVQGSVFAVWAFVAFRSLFRLLALLRHRSGQAIPGARATLSAPRLFLTDPRFGPDRKALALLTPLLLILSLTFAASR
ncbi:hypothetical protein [Pseudotabrizicola sp. 4114]|uniref:hypothetical protein n=1 Tax=Pseudotabrizicola sp. 4114 TaxID=2817731 RepID=UPI00285440A1|nr:hypothetical protein [Pseudorhodobacter sp. 4114]